MSNALKKFSLASAFLLIATASLAQVAPSAGIEVGLESEPIISISLQALGALLMLAVVIENALAVLFGWTVYRAYLSLSGTKAVVSFVVSYLVVRHFEVDVIASLLTEYTPGGNFPSSIGTEALTALVIAGGSAGVRNVMQKLGYRSHSDEKDPDPEPPKDGSWIAVNVKRDAAVGPVRIAINAMDATPEAPTLAGTALSRRRSLASLMLRGINRFPANGGYTLSPGQTYEARVIGTDAQGARLEKPLGDGPFNLMPGAVVDFDVTL